VQVDFVTANFGEFFFQAVEGIRLLWKVRDAVDYSSFALPGTP
jgi:hypothetical protein